MKLQHCRLDSGQKLTPNIVDFGTTFEQIDKLRKTMLEFLESEKRDFSTAFDVTIDGAVSSDILILPQPWSDR